jgi:hypothetical protein
MATATRREIEPQYLTYRLRLAHPVEPHRKRLDPASIA